MKHDLQLPTLPLTYQSAGSILKPKMGIEEIYKPIRNRLRRYSATSLVELSLELLWAKHGDRLQDLQSMPWLTLLVVKWALQDASVNLRVGGRISGEELDAIRQQLWDIPSKDGECARDGNVFLMVRSISNVQIDFQRTGSWAFLRWPSLYARLPESKARQQFTSTFGMEPNTFIDLTFVLYAIVSSGKVPMDKDCLALYRPRYGDAVDKLYGILIRDLAGLRSELQKEPAQRIRGKDELYEFPYFKRFPLIRLRDGRVHCWHREVFIRGIEDVVHLRLSDLFCEDYTQSFSRVFENYVTELAVDTGRPHLTEADYKRVVGAGAPAVELIFEGNDCNVLVEAKMGFFADDVLIQDNEARVFIKTKKVREGIGQGWKVGRLLRERPEWKTRFGKEQDYLLVVTSRELLIGGGEMLRRLYAQGKFGYPDDDPDAVRRLPLTNVFVVSIGDYEMAMSCVKAGLVDLSELMKKAAEANQQENTSRLFFSDFLGDYMNTCPLPKALSTARDDAVARIRQVIG